MLSGILIINVAGQQEAILSRVGAKILRRLRFHPRMLKTEKISKQKQTKMPL